jgi:preprotein translocase subunit SecA
VPAILDKLLRIGEGKILRQLEAVAQAVSAIEDDFVAMSDAELQAMTGEFKQRLEQGESLDDLMPEAFATVREAAKRVIGQRHYDVQIMGGAALHLGNIAEMKTGEGKTCRRTSTRSPARASTSSPSTTTWRATTPSGWAGSTTSSG